MEGQTPSFYPVKGHVLTISHGIGVRTGMRRSGHPMGRSTCGIFGTIQLALLQAGGTKPCMIQ